MGPVTTRSIDRSRTTADATTEEPPAEAVADLNEATIVGSLSGEPERRTLPSGSLAVSFSLTVRIPGEKTTSVPVVWYDPPKRVAAWNVGDVLAVRGSVVRRFFQGAGGLGSSTEVVVRHGDLWRRKRAASKLLSRSVDRLRSVQELRDRG